MKKCEMSSGEDSDLNFADLNCFNIWQLTSKKEKKKLSWKIFVSIILIRRAEAGSELKKKKALDQNPLDKFHLKVRACECSDW